MSKSEQGSAVEPGPESVVSADAEQTLQTGDERLRIALDSSPAVVFEQDRDLRYTWIHNPKYFEPDAVLGKTDLELLPREHALPLTQMKREVLESGVPARRVVQVRLGGHDLHYDLLVEPRRSEAGDIVGILCASWDVSERVSMEAAVRESGRRFRALADCMPQLVWTARPSGVVDYYNARVREYDGLTERTDGTWSWQPVLHPDDLELTMAAWNTAVESGSVYVCEHRVRMADGSLRWHISRAHRVCTEDGERWYGTANDIHEHKLAEERLHQAMATRDEVISVVSHDLRNPLGVVRTSISVLRHLLAPTTPRDEQRNEAFMARLDRQVTTMERLLDELLDVAQLQAGLRLTLQRQTCDLVALVRQLVQEQFNAASHSIELHEAVPALVGEWDAARLERVLGNLLSNAIKYSRAGSSIIVDIEPADDHAVVRVSDRGVGISERDRERIFEWFARGHNAEHMARGSGIGLAGARRIVEQHGGSLTVHSDLGVGSTFIVRLPLREAST